MTFIFPDGEERTFLRASLLKAFPRPPLADMIAQCADQQDEAILVDREPDLRPFFHQGSPLQPRAVVAMLDFASTPRGASFDACAERHSQDLLGVLVAARFFAAQAWLIKRVHFVLQRDYKLEDFLHAPEDEARSVELTLQLKQFERLKSSTSEYTYAELMRLLQTSMEIKDEEICDELTINVMTEIANRFSLKSMKALTNRLDGFHGESFKWLSIDPRWKEALGPKGSDRKDRWGLTAGLEAARDAYAELCCTDPASS